VTWTRDPLADRRTERDRLLALAGGHVERLGRRLRSTVAIVAGSVARGDFNAWSDVDLVVISDDLPADHRARHTLLDAGRPGRVEVHGYTPAEFDAALARGDALAREAATDGIVLDVPRG